MRMRILAGPALVLSIGCQSKARREAAAAKAANDSAVILRDEANRACTIAGFELPPDSAVKMQAECDVATRNLNRFLSGMK